MKKLLSVVIASLVVFAALPFAAAADEAELVPVSISVNMTDGNTMTEYRLGYTNTADPAAPWYYYVISEILRALNPEITVYYKNGAPARTFKYNDKSEIEQESGWSITDKDVPEQTSEKHWAAGDTVTFKFDYMGADCDIAFAIEEFPVVSVSARATKTIMEGKRV